MLFLALLAPTALAADAPSNGVQATFATELIEEMVYPPCSTVRAFTERTPSWAWASSALTEGRITHAASRVIDGNPATAWVEGVDGVGAGEKLVIGFPDGHDMTAGLSIVPGYAKNETRWMKNQRVSAVELRWLVPKEGMDKAPGAPWTREQLVYSDTTGPIRVSFQQEGGVVPFGRAQIIDFPGHLWLHNMETTEFVAVELSILTTDGANATYEDTCISEIRLLEYGAEGKTTCHPGWCAGPGKGDDGCGSD